ncbi:response regulator [Paenibacillus hexagrammi]|uniref:Response regulator n=1 Tax=Paenibacillus hexagrammi TaxID=2908839 RepID=A0ABY3SH25_9BACL|nr:response regulator [Paenibacillus sp. YPD9-1]UJF32491.1 response regulator [Paenibacillus sp. YPD9-1]
MWRVMLVDDEPLVLEGMRVMVDWNRYSFDICGEATDGSEALELIGELRPDVVFTDIRMPLLTGIDLIQRTNESMKQPPTFVILSGYDDFSYAQTAMRENVSDYLLKPIDEQEIETVLKRLQQELGQKQRTNEEMEQKRQLLVSTSGPDSYAAR